MRDKRLLLLLFLTPVVTFAQEMTIDEKIEAGFKPFADWIGSIVFYSISIY